MILVKTELTGFCEIAEKSHCARIDCVTMGKRLKISNCSDQAEKIFSYFFNNKTPINVGPYFNGNTPVVPIMDSEINKNIIVKYV